MIVVMAAGLAANLTINPLDLQQSHPNCYDFGGRPRIYECKNTSSICIGLTFVATLILNFIALQVVKKYREQYE